jgi:murein DD-endopeptidase MepM/ murein hydrolase activator NlpD
MPSHHRYYRSILWTSIFLLSTISLFVFLWRPAEASSPRTLSQSADSGSTFYHDLVFGDPFGTLVPHSVYRPRITHDSSGNVIEDTSYGVRNPDMGGGTCFGVDWSQIFHAGEDLYAGQADSSASTQNAEVRAVADGMVVFAPTAFNYPGFVVIIEHALNSGEKIYSVYAHLKGPLNVKNGQHVARGDVLGRVMYQPYTGNYPKYHPSGDDSHLHFEIRQFYSGAAIYPYPSSYCNNSANIPGVGYTYPVDPGNFPEPGKHYLDPFMFILSHQGHVFLPRLVNSKLPPAQ